MRCRNPSTGRDKRALLFDTGPGVYGIRAIIRSFTSLPLIVIPSHLHFDHVGNLNEFDNVRLLDTSALRAQANHGVFTERPSQYMLRHSFRFRVSGWVRDGAAIDLGSRTVRVVATPGHTPDSVSVIDEPATRRIFTGDLISRLTLVNVPGSDIHALSASLHKLLALTPAGTRAYEAHFDEPIGYSQLVRLAADTAAMAAGRGTWRRGCLGRIPTRQYEVDGFIFLLPTKPGALMEPFGAATERLEWLAASCGR
jgi:glyoxylase-like metal-dependent hydrolase (beta-lactamase superfamily II)